MFQKNSLMLKLNFLLNFRSRVNTVSITETFTTMTEGVNANAEI